VRAVAALGIAAEILFAAWGLRVGQKDCSGKPDPLARFPCAKGERPIFFNVVERCFLKIEKFSVYLLL
jgi:hypothetical protein